MNAKPGRKKSKNVSYFSHEYIITNHGDIVSFAAMIIVIGLLFKASAPLASLFIVLHHNVTHNDTSSREMLMYTPGRRDFFLCFFYTLISIVVHAVIQEYVLDKLNRKLHLSKVKNSKFHESGQLIVFYLASAGWAGYLIYTEKLITSLASMWQGYPDLALSFWLKFYFIAQICYWLHGYPELYFQKVKKEDMAERLVYTTLYLVAVSAAYMLNLSRIALCLLILHYSVEFLFHVSRVLYFAGKTKVARVGFALWNLVFVVVRIATTTLAYLAFAHGLAKSSVDAIDFEQGNFNTRLIRFNCLAFVLVVQAYLMWNFITLHLRRHREQAAVSKATFTNAGAQQPAQKKKEKKKDT